MERRFTPRSRSSWRSWLEKNHAAQDSVWLVFFKRHTGKPTLTYDDAVEEAVCFGWIDGVKRRIDDERYTHRFSPRTPNSHWSATNRKRAARMNKAGLMTAAGRKAIATAKKRGTWNVEGVGNINLSVPEELAAQLRINPKAATFFESLTTSYQQQFTGWINIAKREETRKRRVAKTIELLARGKKFGMR